MKIALFYPRNPLASWYTLGGYSQTLTTMGHDVTDCPLPGNLVQNVHAVRAALPTIDQLLEHDCVVVGFMEYVLPWLQAAYGPDPWSRLVGKVPVVARFDESFDRPDLFMRERVDDFKRFATHHSYPAAQDADDYHGQWEGFGCDSTKFYPDPGATKKYAVGFIGSMYPKRQEYLSSLAPHIPNSVTFHLGQVWVQDLSGIRGDLSTELLASSYRSIKVFFCLPPLSRLLVCKAFEVMGTGTMLMYPKLPGPAAKNMELFEDGKHLVYYDPGYLSANAEQLMHYLNHDAEREAIAKSGCQRVHQNHTLEAMFERVLGMAFDESEVRPKMTKEYRERHGIGARGPRPEPVLGGAA